MYESSDDGPGVVIGIHGGSGGVIGIQSPLFLGGAQFIGTRIQVPRVLGGVIGMQLPRVVVANGPPGLATA